MRMTHSGHEQAAVAAMHRPDLLYFVRDPWPLRKSMKRRHGRRLLGAAAAAWPLAARGQQPAVPVIGYFSSQSRDYDAPRLAALRQTLSEAGYVEGKTIAIEYRWAEGDYDRLAGQAAEFARPRGAVLFAGSLPAALAAQSATTTITIEFGIGALTVQLGLVTGLYP